MRFFVPGVAVAQPRHNAGVNRKTGKLNVYLDRAHPVHGFKQDVALRARQAVGRGALLGGALFCEMLFAFGRGALAWKLSVPDFDNLAKSVLDACKGVVFADDATVCAARVLKVTGGVPAGVYCLFRGAPPVEFAVGKFLERYNR